MLLIPAIDLKSGRCVRLKQGDLSQETVYSEDPAEVATNWLRQGATRLHVVDLDGADGGKPKNLPAMRAILSAVGSKMEVQIGGGLRIMDALEFYFELGAHFAVLGTAAVRNPGFLDEACTAYPGRIIVALDARHGKLAVQGWGEETAKEVLDVAKRCEQSGAAAILFTDILRDGMLVGPNVQETADLARALITPVLASGGLSSLKDIEALCAEADSGIQGAIIGRALYEKKFKFSEAQALVKRLNP